MSTNNHHFFTNSEAISDVHDQNDQDEEIDINSIVHNNNSNKFNDFENSSPSNNIEKIKIVKNNNKKQMNNHNRKNTNEYSLSLGFKEKPFDEIMIEKSLEFMNQSAKEGSCQLSELSMSNRNTKTVREFKIDFKIISNNKREGLLAKKHCRTKIEKKEDYLDNNKKKVNFDRNTIEEKKFNDQSNTDSDLLRGLISNPQSKRDCAEGRDGNKVKGLQEKSKKYNDNLNENAQDYHQDSKKDRAESYRPHQNSTLNSIQNSINNQLLNRKKKEFNKNHKKQNFDLNSYVDKTRINSKNLIFEALIKNYDSNDQRTRNTIENIANEIESSLYNILKVYYNNKSSKYNTQVKAIVSNLKDENNKEFKDQILKREINLERLALMNSTEMAPSEKREERIKKVQEAFNSRNLDSIQEESKQFEGVCPKCGSNEVLENNGDFLFVLGSYSCNNCQTEFESKAKFRK